MSLDLPTIESELLKIKIIRAKFIKEKKRGSLNFYIQTNGGLERVFKIFGSIPGFCNALLESGYARQYVDGLEKKWR